MSMLLFKIIGLIVGVYIVWGLGHWLTDTHSLLGDENGEDHHTSE